MRVTRRRLLGHDRRYLLVVLLLLPVPWSCDSQSPGAEGVADLAIDQAALLGHLRFFAADSLRGRLAGTGDERQSAEYIRDRFASYGLQAATAGYFQVFALGAAAGHAESARAGDGRQPSVSPLSQNVLASLPGAGSLAGEWVILGAHYDHVGFEIVADTVVVYNGADDNASGAALLLEVTRVLSEWVALSQEGERRSIMFQAYGAEEAGLLGSSHFVEQPTVPLDRIAAMINMDMVGRLRNGAVAVGGVATDPTWIDVLEDVNRDGLALMPDDGALHRSDTYPFVLADVAALGLSTGGHLQYHTPFDDVGLLNLDGMERIGGLVTRLVWALATR